MKQVCLGAAMWGWSVQKEEAYRILDSYYSDGGRFVDTANNYPISGKVNDYRKSAVYISDWCQNAGVSDLKITYKIGSTTNGNTPDSDLGRDNVYDQIDKAKELFGNNLHCIMVHWDNRNEIARIRESISVILSLLESRMELGLSGIKFPYIYREVLKGEGLIGVNVQVKSNYLISEVGSYEEINCLDPKYWAYGISVSGLKLSQQDYREDSYVKLVRDNDFHNNCMTDSLKKKILNCLDKNEALKSIYHLALAFSEQDERLYGYIVAPSSVAQMKDIIRFRNSIELVDVDLSELSEA